LLFLCTSKLDELGKTIKVGAVSYLNTKPLLYGLKHGFEIENLELTEGFPARIAEMLLKDEIDLGLVPVAILPKLKDYYIVTDYCIGAEGPVGSVCLFSEVPLDQIETVLLDYQSRTSVALAKILIRDYWKISPLLEDATPDFREQIKGTTAAVVIGDRAFEQRKISPYIYDLAEAWKDFTGLPFVFAAWIANKKLPAEFITKFNEANSMGVNAIDRVVAENPYGLYDLHQYFSKNISYNLTAQKREGLQKFLSLLMFPNNAIKDPQRFADERTATQR
jgi:chorismate dehydratase